MAVTWGHLEGFPSTTDMRYQKGSASPAEITRMLPKEEGLDPPRELSPQEKGTGPPPDVTPTSFLLSAEELSSLDTNSLLLKLSLMPLAGDLEDDDLEVAPFLSPFPFTCFSSFFFFFFDFSLHRVGGAEERGAASPGWQCTGPRTAQFWGGQALPATCQHTYPLWLSALLPTLYSFMAFS